VLDRVAGDLNGRDPQDRLLLEARDGMRILDAEAAPSIAGRAVALLAAARKDDAPRLVLTSMPSA
jgi:hypothetical protein